VAGLACPHRVRGRDWKNVAVVDTNCIAKVKSTPTPTPPSARSSARRGIRLVTADGTYLKFDAAGNEKACHAQGHPEDGSPAGDGHRERDGETIKVTALSID